jgi:hypothetical protein
MTSLSYFQTGHMISLAVSLGVFFSFIFILVESLKIIVNYRKNHKIKGKHMIWYSNHFFTLALDATPKFIGWMRLGCQTSSVRYIYIYIYIIVCLCI